MRTDQSHRDLATAEIEKGTTVLTIKQMLMEKGLTKSQANDVVRNQRKRLKVYGMKKKDEVEREENGLRWGQVHE